MGNAGGRTAAVTIEDSAKGVIDVAEKVTMNDSGSFWSFQGNKLSY